MIGCQKAAHGGEYFIITFLNYLLPLTDDRPLISETFWKHVSPYEYIVRLNTSNLEFKKKICIQDRPIFIFCIPIIGLWQLGYKIK